MEHRLTLRSLRALAVLALATLVIGPAPVAAHAELVSTTPADGDELDAPPDEVVMVFDGELDPEASGFTVTDPSGAEVGAGEVDLEVADRNEMRGAVESAEPGEYTVTWTAVAADGHESEGAFGFTVGGEPSTAGPNPDTALPVPTPGAAQLAGVLAIVAGIVSALWRIQRAAT